MKCNSEASGDSVESYSVKEHSRTLVANGNETPQKTTEASEMRKIEVDGRKLRAVTISADSGPAFQIKIIKSNNQKKPEMSPSSKLNSSNKFLGISLNSNKIEGRREKAINHSNSEISENVSDRNKILSNLNNTEIIIPLFLLTSYNKIIAICKAILQYNNGAVMKNNNKYKENDDKNYDNNNDKNRNSHDDNENNCDNQYNSWVGVRSLLITAHEGAGKSYLLDKIEDSLLSTFCRRNEYCDRNIMILKLSSKNCESKTLFSATSTSTTFSSFMASSSSSVPNQTNSSDVHYGNNDRNNFNNNDSNKDFQMRRNTRFHLHQFVKLLQTEKQENKNTDFTQTGIRTALNIILLIDDLDSLLLPFVKDDNNNISDNGDDNDYDKNSVCAIAAFHLRKLLILLAMPNNDCDRIAIIGATRLSPASLPCANVGTFVDRLKVTVYHDGL